MRQDLTAKEITVHEYTLSNDGPYAEIVETKLSYAEYVLQGTGISCLHSVVRFRFLFYLKHALIRKFKSSVILHVGIVSDNIAVTVSKCCRQRSRFLAPGFATIALWRIKDFLLHITVLYDYMPDDP